MQQSEFEKNIQSKLDVFTLIPNEAVWEKVSAKIAGEKKRRRFAWMFAALVVLGGGGTWVWLYEGIRSKPEIAVTSNQVKKGEATQATKRSVAEQKQQRRNEPVDMVESTENESTDAEKDIKNINGHLNQSSTTASKVTSNNRAASKELIASSSSKPSKSGARDIELANITPVAGGEASKEIPPHVFLQRKGSTPGSEGVREHDTIKRSEKSTAGAALAKEHASKKAAGSKLRIGFNLLVGLSNNLSESLFREGTVGRASSVPGMTGSVGGSMPSLKYSGGVSFGIGVFLQKDVSKRLSLSLGAGYHFFSAKSAVGSAVTGPLRIYDSSQHKEVFIDEYYNPGQSTNYSNIYHMVQLPIGLVYRLNRRADKAICVEGAIVPGLIAGSRALYANGSAQKYYVEHEQFQQFQLGAQGTLMFTLTSSSKYNLSLGPVVQYNITNLTKRGLSSDQHLLFTGIRTSLTLK